MEDVNAVAEIGRQLEADFSSIQRVALSGVEDPAVLRLALQLRMAKLKAISLRKLEWEDKTELLLNRATKRMEIPIGEIEALVGLPVFAAFPCDYADVTRSIRQAESSPKLAASIKQFVGKLDERKAPEDKRPRFIERFSVVPGRYGFR